MTYRSFTQKSYIPAVAVLIAAVLFLYASVLARLASDWWTDENYSHGLLVPFVIALIVWAGFDRIKRAIATPSRLVGAAIIAVSFLMLVAGTLGAELFTQRVSCAVMAAGIIVYLFGLRLLNILAVPFALFLLSVPIPQILFNRIAFPLQIWASQMAVWGIRLFDVPTLRKGNVIDILPAGSTQAISLEVVEACSGIRSLMTLVTLALVLAYFTRRDEGGRWFDMSGPDLFRTVLLMVAAVPIAVLTNAFRVTATGVMTFYYGKQAASSSWHDASGWLVYVVALGLLLGLNWALSRMQGASADAAVRDLELRRLSPFAPRIWPLAIVIVAAGLGMNWFVSRGEVAVERRPLTSLNAMLGEWRQKGSEIKFSEQTESVLKVSDYTMREYTHNDGRLANIYIGYYASQRTGATYHSPQNCLPGAGWVMKDPQYIEITRPDGTAFTANRYIIENGVYREVMIYWYQGRGRVEASEYNDKLNTILDSVTRRRSDGAIVRVMTSVGYDEASALAAAADLSWSLAAELPHFVPE